MNTIRYMWPYGIDTAIMKQNKSFDVNMFLPTIAGHGTREQQDEWIPCASSNAIFGTYAQVI